MGVGGEGATAQVDDHIVPKQSIERQLVRRRRRGQWLMVRLAIAHRDDLSVADGKDRCAEAKPVGELGRIRLFIWIERAPLGIDANEVDRVALRNGQTTVDRNHAAPVMRPCVSGALMRKPASAS